MRRIAFAALGLWLACAAAQAQQASTLTLPIAPACAPAEPCTLWSFLGLSGHSMKRCRSAFCCSGLGRMCDSVAAPLHHVSGGIVPRVCCHLPSREDIACMSAENCSLAEMVAARIKRDAAEACSRRAAVRFLGTVDCHYYHEAEEALIAHLRADQSECVRLEAATVLGKGCCCTPRTIAALKIAVDGTAEDGNPPERSERVRAAALQALEACLACENALFAPPQPPAKASPLEELPPPVPPTESRVQLTSYSTLAPKAPAHDALLEAQRSYAARVGAGKEEQKRRAPRNLLEIITQAAEEAAAAREQPRRLELTPIGVAPLGAVR
jgi:hypothetical protein